VIGAEAILAMGGKGGVNDGFGGLERVGAYLVIGIMVAL